MAGDRGLHRPSQAGSHGSTTPGCAPVSGHDGFVPGPRRRPGKAGYEQTLENANTMGQKFTGRGVVPGPVHDGRDSRSSSPSAWTRRAQMAKDAGLQFFYHNHDFEFVNKQPDGTPNFDILLNENDAGLVKFELDIYWIIYRRREPARVPRARIRPATSAIRSRTAPGRRARTGEQEFEDAGPGSIDFPDVVRGRASAARGPTSTTSSSTTPRGCRTPNDPEAEFKTALAGVQVPPQRADSRRSRGRPGPPTGGPGRSRSAGASPAKSTRPCAGRGARRS